MNFAGTFVTPCEPTAGRPTLASSCCAIRPAFDGMAAFSRPHIEVGIDKAREQARGVRVSGNSHDLLGAESVRTAAFRRLTTGVRTGGPDGPVAAPVARIGFNASSAIRPRSGALLRCSTSRSRSSCHAPGLMSPEPGLSTALGALALVPACVGFIWSAGVRRNPVHERV